ncbi:MAG: hypothetical protein JWN70_3226 [Planctomycetaceae bacterium]|nr:hypothetical protein [Planctomycetaceae bacterium]
MSRPLMNAHLKKQTVGAAMLQTRNLDSERKNKEFKECARICLCLRSESRELSFRR